ncbi:hypothetical protein EW146_g1908 [Bondarzewia mesenterica]|uniref:RING-type E3 ubiquitin transferase n=1 Tax=Bondarzewia mesenterica TaxID=1095465 RepID=A0A4S4M2U7_9AGAM|nr:hypothetical protein EW146_g1908 [Bondarzewia mesenterica]
MGQHTSRVSRPTTEEPANVVESSRRINDIDNGADTTPGRSQNPHSSLDPELLSSDIPSSSKRSKRKSIIGAITGRSKPSTASARGRMDSTASSATERSSNVPSNRRRWRMSRRWSRTPTESNEDIAVSSSRPGGEDVEGASGSVLGRKGKERATESPAIETGPPSAISILHPNTLPFVEAPDESSSARVVPVEQADAELERNPRTTIGPEEATDEEVIRPSSSPDDPPPPPPESTAPPVPPITDSRNDGPVRPPGRQFPPAGTLVVVQGVVHTTDVAASSQPSQTPAPRPPGRSASVPVSDRNTGRNRLSSLISRPMHSRPTSFVSPDSQSPSQSSDQASSDSRNSQDESSFTSEDAQAAISTTGDSPQQGPTESQSPSRFTPLSPTSIDVLGTLLSVATAATAASLVTGSSDPLFSSGLALPGATNLQPPTTLHDPDLSANRPTSPTPTAGLGGRERMRSAWDNIRDRIGLRNSASNTSGSSSTPGINPLGSTDRADPRSQLLAEMARAFNLGMGLESNTTNGPSASAGGSDPSSPPIEVNLGAAPNANRPLPPEDSFERFLMDLQIDLRRTLTEEPSQLVPETPAPVSNAAPSQSSAEDSRSDFLPWPLAFDELMDGVRPQSASGENVTSSGEDSSAQASADPQGDVENDNLPSLMELSDSDSDSDDVGTQTGSHLDSSTSTTSTIPAAAPDISITDTGAVPPPPLIPSLGPRTASGSERRPGGGINWWRMYRFPPQQAPSSQGLAVPGSLSTASPSNPLSSLASGVPMPLPADAASSTNSSDLNNGAVAAGDNMIVPVIVVGLQSVNSTGRDAYTLARTHTPDETHGGANDNATEGGVDADDVDDDMADGRPGTPRGRPWRSRAANAFRGLRPGRRDDAPAVTRAGEGNGSTTFFIYVIGGYYPPNHHLVTGNDPLDSFEALWELAELLGQVKPPTATKEDIAKSGLEVIRQAELETYEKDGRVSSNCIDRCLICLEDYVPEDDLRLLTCRHLFHKNCVDRWLETGRNNCPACRSQGVSTGPGSSVPGEVPSMA